MTCCPEAKMPFMKQQGAFVKENLHLHTFDQMKLRLHGHLESRVCPD